jgi:murein L,D-transpeptidase YafK
MTRRNMIQHGRSPNTSFWKMLKAGSDLFEAMRRSPSVSLCDHRYAFHIEADGDLDTSAFCPSKRVPLPVSEKNGVAPARR